MGTLGGSAPASHPATPALRAASPNPPALWRSREGRVRRTRGGGRGGVGPEAPTKSVGKARLRQRELMGTLGGFPNPRALWRRREGRVRRTRGGGRGGVGPEAPTKSVGKARLRQRELMGTLGGSAPASHPATPALRAASPNPRPLPATLLPARFARPRALWRRREGRVRRTRGGGRGGVGPEAPRKSVAKARLRQRELMGTLGERQRGRYQKMTPFHDGRTHPIGAMTGGRGRRRLTVAVAVADGYYNRPRPRRFRGANPSARYPQPATLLPARFARPRALWRRREGRVRRTRGGGRGGVGPEAPRKSVAKARLRQRELMGTLGERQRGRYQKMTPFHDGRTHPIGAMTGGRGRRRLTVAVAVADGYYNRPRPRRFRGANPSARYPNPPPSSPLASLGLARSGGGARGASEGREGEGVEV